MRKIILRDSVVFRLPSFGFRKVVFSLTNKGYILRDAYVKGDDAFFRADRRDAPKIIAFFDEMCYTYETKESRGVAESLRRFFRRKGLVAGILAVTLVLGFFNVRLGNIEIYGLKLVESSAVFEVLETEGIKKGIYTKNINKKRLEYAITKSIDSIAFTFVKLSGSRLTINVYEELPPPDIFDMTEELPVRAAKDGVVTRIVTFAGTAAVREGEAVKAGEVLISPAINVGGIRIGIRAVGDVYAKVYYKGEALFCENVTVSRRNGTVKAITELRLCGKLVGKPAVSPYDMYDEEIIEEVVFGPAPVRITRHYYYELVAENAVLSFESELPRLVETAKESAKKNLPRDGEVLDSWYVVRDVFGLKSVEFYYEVEERISIY